MDRLSKDFPVFDCDAHVNDPLEIWARYVPEAERELVRACYWRDDNQAWLNATTKVVGGGSGEFAPLYNPICIAGPQMNKKILRKLMSMVPLDDEQRDYLLHRGAFDPQARIRDLDLMGIDQVLVIPTMSIMNLPFAEDPEGARSFCGAYNRWVHDWCSEEPGRLFGAALLPLQSPEYAAAEVRRAAELGLAVGLIRPIDARGAYPNNVGSELAGLFGAETGTLDPLFRAFEDTGVVLGMHTFPAGVPGRTAGPGCLASPGELVAHAGVDFQTFSFVFEMQDWLAQILLAGFLDRYPRLKMAVFESNAEWLPYLLSTCDRLFKLYAGEREVQATRLPSEAFAEQCVISFESDEVSVFRQWEQFRRIGIWASDAYHHDGSDAWSAMRAMEEHGVPHDAQVDLLGGNARRFYGIEPKVFVTEEPPPIERPAWFPQGPELEQWAELIANPRLHADELRELGLESPLAVMARQLVESRSPGL